MAKEQQRRTARHPGDDGGLHAQATEGDRDTEGRQHAERPARRPRADCRGLSYPDKRDCGVSQRANNKYKGTMTIEEFQKAAAYVDAMHDENERLDKIMHAHKIVNEGKVEKLILLGTNIDGASVGVQMEIPKDILLEAIQQTWDKYAINIEELKEMLREL